MVYGNFTYPTRSPRCIVGKKNYYTHELNIKVCIILAEFTPIRKPINTISLFLQINNVPKPLTEVQCYVVETVDRNYDFIEISATGKPSVLPDFCRLFEKKRFKSLQDYFNQSEEFKSNSHCADLIYPELGLDLEEHYTNMASARGRYPPQEYADEIRQKQASKLAFR